MAKGTELATKAPAAVAVHDYSAYAGAGFEDAQQGDFAPSFLRVLQGTSPQIESVEGAKPGLIIDTITNDLYTAVDFIPAVREHVYVAWIPRTPDGPSAGAGFGGVFPLTHPEVKAALARLGDKFQRGADGKIIQPKTADGTFDLIETVYFHGVQRLPNATLIPVSVPFFSTNLTGAQNWYTSMSRQMIPGTNKRAPLFSHVTNLGSLKKEKGTNKWYIFTTAWAGGSAEAAALAPDSMEFQAGFAVWNAFREGKATVNYGQSGGSAEAAETRDADIPF